MTEYARWVAPVAERFAATRKEIAQLAAEAPESAWVLPSPVDGWTYQDVLSHLAEGYLFSDAVIRSVIEDTDRDMRPLSAAREERIAASLSRGAELTTDALIDKVTREGEATLRLLARLTDAHAGTLVITSRTDPAPVSLQHFLSTYYHDEEHLEHLRPALMTAEVAR